MLERYRRPHLFHIPIRYCYSDEGVSLCSLYKGVLIYYTFNRGETNFTVYFQPTYEHLQMPQSMV